MADENGGNAGTVTAPSPSSPATAAPADTGQPLDSTPYEAAFGRVVGNDPEPAVTRKPLPKDTPKEGVPSSDGEATTPTAPDEQPANDGKGQPSPATPKQPAQADEIEVPADLAGMGLVEQFGETTTKDVGVEPNGKPAETSSTVDAPNVERVLKELNPDGSLTAEQQLRKAAERLVQDQVGFGKQSTEIGELRKIKSAMEQVSEFFTVEGNQIVGINAGKFVERFGADILNESLSQRGLRIVPTNFEGGDPDEALVMEHPEMRQLIERLVPEKELSFEEKLSLVNDDADKKLDVRDMKRELLTRTKVRVESEGRGALAALQAKYDEAAKKDGGASKWPEIVKRMGAWGQRIPPTLVRGKARVQMLETLARGEMLPQIVKEMAPTIYKQGFQAALKKISLGQPSGSAPMHPAPSKRGAEDDETPDPAFTAAMRG